MSSVLLDLPGDEITSVFGDIGIAALEVEQIHAPVAGATVGVWRVRADTRTAILKLLAQGDRGHPNWRAGPSVSHWMFWRREACAYESDLFVSMADGLRAPACYHVSDRPDGSVALWIEDLTGRNGSDWSVDDYGPAARHLGRWQGHALADGRARTDPWLSRKWLHSYLSLRDVDDDLLADDHLWRTAVLAEWFDARDVARMRAMRTDRPMFLDSLATLPPVVCHLDLHPRNLFADPSGTTAMIDWAYVGIGRVGEDVGNLVPDSVLDFHVSVDQIQRLDHWITAAYNDGLADAGAPVDPARVRLGMSATMAAKYAWIGPAIARAVVAERDTLNGRSTTEAIKTWAPAVRYLLDRADEARHLVDS